MSTSSGKPSPMSWKNFLMKAEIEEEEASEGGKWILRAHVGIPWRFPG